MNKHLKLLLLVCLIAGSTFLIFNEALAQTSGEATYVSGITAGRARSLVGVFVGLISLVAGVRAKRRAAKGDVNLRSGATLALVLGAIGFVLSIIHMIVTAGAVFGSGSGKAGAIAGIVLNLTGMVIAALALRKGNENGK